ncbi:hypothetical protein [Singulisphaera sp. PoT]|uniref:hypothetical protein n=1 Tax=Singulisphaera sp. PoT TaxID=3411797 RepID=UPI003BF4E555
MDRIGLKGMSRGAIVGLLIALTLWVEIRYVFPMPDSKPTGFMVYLVLMGAFIGWALGEFRSRTCTKCGASMGRPHFPAGEGPGPILYRCGNCGEVIPFEDAVAYESKAESNWSA